MRKDTLLEISPLECDRYTIKFRVLIREGVLREGFEATRKFTSIRRILLFNHSRWKETFLCQRRLRRVMYGNKNVVHGRQIFLSAVSDWSIVDTASNTNITYFEIFAVYNTFDYNAVKSSNKFI